MAASTTPAEFDWAKLDAPKPMPTKTSIGTITVDVLAKVPAPIRERAEASLAINTKAVAAKATSNAARPRVDYHWDIQPVASKEMGEAFIKQVTKYAKYRPADKPIPHIGKDVAKGQCTARTGEVTHYRAVDDDGYVACDAQAEGAFLGVRYSVRPLEVRNTTNRLPGTAA